MSTPYYFPVVIVVLLLLAGCKTTAIKPPPAAPIPPALQSLPADVNPLNTPENMQSDLAKPDQSRKPTGDIASGSATAPAKPLVPSQNPIFLPVEFNKVSDESLDLRTGSAVRIYLHDKKLPDKKGQDKK